MNAPFFDLFGEVSEPIAPKRTTGQGCESCLRYKACKTPKFPVYGQGKRRILIITEFPAAGDDASGTPLSGDAGSILHRELRKHGIDIYRDCWVTHAVRCHDPEDSKRGAAGVKGPDAKAITSCKPKLHGDIASLRPRVIIPMGIRAISSLLGDRLSGRLNNIKPTAFMGCTIPDQDLQAWVVPVESPFYLLAAGDRNQDILDIFAEGIAGAVEKSRIEFPAKPPDNIRTFRNPKDATAFLDTLHRQAVADGFEVGFDYETTGIKPHAPGHKIVCASVGWLDQCAAFPMFPDPEFREAWKQLLTDPQVDKGAHNAQFEATWTHTILGYWPEGWAFDTCLDAHVVHNTRPVNLKFETYTRLGILGYDSQIDKYLKSKDKGGNEFNDVENAPPELLLKYCALDSRYMMEIRAQQVQDLRKWPKQVKGSRFFLNASMSLAKDSAWGMRVDTEGLESAYRDLSLQIEEAEKQAYACPEVVAMGSGFSLSSNKDLGSLVFGKLGYKGKSVDKEFLQTVTESFAEHLLEARQLRKMRDTYLEQYRREAVSGVIHGAFNLAGGMVDDENGGADSYRASHSAPNLANIPKRNKKMQKAIRSLYKPTPGNRIKEYDYGQIEVRVGACYHLDKNMLAYVNDPKTNMHTDSAMDLFLRGDAGSVRKPERQAAKNGFVFPSFYGSGCTQTYLGIWKQIEQETKDHLASKGIVKLQPKDWNVWDRDRRRDYIKAVKRAPDDTWLSHVAGVEKILWEDRFPGYAKWKRDIYDSYLQKGYIELYTGFRCRGPLIFTKATNLQIQGSSFHCLLWTISQIDQKVRDISGRSSIVCNIHDALVVDLHPDDEAEVDRLVWDYGTQKVRSHWDWIITPLVIEAERSEIDGSWAAMENCGELHLAP